MANLTDYEYDIFLSHNHADQDWTTKLAERLEQEDWQGRKIKVFFSPWDIRPGQSIPQRIEQALPKSRKVGLILSPDAMKSAWVELERLVTTYISVSARDERLIPLYRRDCDIPALLRPISYIDFRDDAKFEENYQTLLTVIKDEPLPRRSRSPVHDSAKLSALIPRPPVVGFVARRDSEGRDIVERLKKELAPEKNQLLVLWGSGGVGKTTLAGQACRALMSLFPGGIAWISADGKPDFGLSTLLDAIATHLRRPELRQLAPEPKSQSVHDGLLDSPTPLIVLDNFETISPEEQDLCAGWLAARASCPVLITSRDEAPHARPIHILAMSPSEANEFLQKLIDEARKPKIFGEMDRNTLIEAAGGIPLVLEWLVKQIDSAKEPQSVLEDLARGGGDAAQRVFDRSFELTQTGDDGRATLLALSLFVPSGSRGALAEVSGFGADLSRLEKALQQLDELWLIETTEQNQRVSVQGLTRQLALARLKESPDSKQIRERFISYFLTYAESNAKSTAEDYEALENERDNLLAAMDVGSDLKEWQPLMKLAYVIAMPVHGFLMVHGYWDDAISRLEQGLEAARQSNSDDDIAAFAHNAAIVHTDRGEQDEARDLCRESLDISKRRGLEKNVSRTLHQLGILAHNRGELQEAQQLYDESLAIAKKVDDQSGVAQTLHQLADLAHAQGNFSEAHELYNESLRIKKVLGHQRGIAASLHNLGRLVQSQNRFDEARMFYRESLDIKRGLGDQNGIAITLGQLGKLEENEGNNAEAARLYKEALKIFEKLGSRYANLARQDLERLESKSS